MVVCSDAQRTTLVTLGELYLSDSSVFLRRARATCLFRRHFCYNHAWQKITAKKPDTNEYFGTVSRLPPGGSLGTPKIDETWECRATTPSARCQKLASGAD